MEALMANELSKDSILYIYADGPKNFLPELNAQIEETRVVLQKKQWCKEVHIITSEFNKGLASSIVDGVTEIVNKYGKVIVLEDDIVSSAGFLKYMNEALNRFQDDEKVMHVSGYMYPISEQIVDGTIFLKVMSCWGWATWKRAWQFYSDDLGYFIAQLDTPEKISKFNIKGNGPFYNQLLQNKDGLLNTWAVRWYSSWYFKNGTSLFPKTSLVKNIGFDGSGTHSRGGKNYVTNIKALEVNISQSGNTDEENGFLEKINSFYKVESKEKKRLLNIFPFKTTIKSKVYKILARVIHKLFSIYSLNHKQPLIETNKNDIHDSYISKKAKIYGNHRFVASYLDDYSYVAHNANVSETKIGKFCSIGPNLMSGRGIHPTDMLSTSPMFYSVRKQNGISLSYINKIRETKPIRIGNDVFIGMNVVILDGIIIGDGAVIGASTVVSKDIPPYAIAVGNPIKIIKYRFDQTTIDELLSIAWWDFDEDELKEVERHFDDVEGFIKKYKKAIHS
ncbi:MAG TPA: CatB-related O-acetyltransferase [Pelobium sp.]|nr:CatB-related O-acetyltransferase [Pelobium sp.]